jgi:hypothetical protein
MSPINLAIVGLRLLAVYCFVEMLPLLAQSASFVILSGQEAFGHSQFIFSVTALLSNGLCSLLAVLLYTYSKPLARRLAPPPAAEPKESVCTFEQLQAIAFAVTGILIVTEALPRLGSALQGLVFMQDYRTQAGTIPSHQINWFYDAGVIAQVVVGLVLLLNPMGFRNAWRWLRTAGT